jgi:hypothetical protein
MMYENKLYKMTKEDEEYLLQSMNRALSTTEGRHRDSDEFRKQMRLNRQRKHDNKTKN